MLITPEDFKEKFLAADATAFVPHAGVSLTSSSQVERTQALNVLHQLPLHNQPTALLQINPAADRHQNLWRIQDPASTS